MATFARILVAKYFFLLPWRPKWSQLGALRAHEFFPKVWSINGKKFSQDIKTDQKRNFKTQRASTYFFLRHDRLRYRVSMPKLKLKPKLKRPFCRKFMAIRFFLDPVRVLSIGCNPIQVLLIRFDPVQVLTIQSDPIRSGFCKRPFEGKSPLTV